MAHEHNCSCGHDHDHEHHHDHEHEHMDKYHEAFAKLPRRSLLPVPSMPA